MPTVAGLLLFGNDDSMARFLPRAAVVATRFAGENAQAPVVERLELQGNLATLYESCLRFVKRYCDLWESRPTQSESHGSEAPIAARANYHRAVLSAAVANALVHRDLVVRDVTTRLHVFDRTIEIVNPRRSTGFAPMALKAIKFGAQERLNPRIASIFSSPGYGLQLAQGGLPMLLREARAFSSRLPDISAFNDEFRLRLHGI